MISFVRPVRLNSAKVRFRREARRNQWFRLGRDLHRLSTVATQVQAMVHAVRIARSRRCTRPSLHHATPAFEKIVPEISSLDASNRMRQRRLHDLPGLPRIGAPVPERASETKWNLLNTRFPEQLARIGIRHDRPVPDGDAGLDPSAVSSDSLRISSTLQLNLI